MSHPQKISGIVERICPGVSSGRKGVAEIKERWEELVGKTLCEHTAPRKIRRDTLIVAANEPSWATELAAVSPIVLRGVNEILGGKRVKRVRVSSRRAGKDVRDLSVKGGEEEGSKVVVTGFEEELEAIGDETIRESLIGLMMEKIRWEQRKEK